MLETALKRPRFSAVHCSHSLLPHAWPHTGAQPLPEAGAQRTLEGVARTPWFGAALVQGTTAARRRLLQGWACRTRQRLGTMAPAASAENWMAMQLFVIEAIISSRSLRSLMAARWPLVWSALASLHA
jgi:hypothetical protein